jgi:hypothetical protein
MIAVACLPAKMVELKLAGLLKTLGVGVSQVIVDGRVVSMNPARTP